MNNDQNREQTNRSEQDSPEIKSESRQEQTDPQLTELKGFTDPSKDLEPTLTDGTKAPEKAKENRAEDDSVR